MRRLRVAALLSAGLLAACGRADAPPHPNVLLISIDSLRADHLSSYGYLRPTSPNLDRLAREGTVFGRAYAASSWAVASQMTMLTGLPPSLHGVDDVGRRLDAARMTLAERLRAAGYRTTAFVSGPDMHAAFGFDQGFERYENATAFRDEDFVAGDATRPSAHARARARHEVTGPAIAEAVGRWIDMDARPPFFAFVHLGDPRADYVPPPPYDTRFDPGWDGDFDFSRVELNAAIGPDMPARALRHLIALYDGEIAATDAAVGRIVAALEERGLLDGTLVVVTADHGEEFLEHGGKGHARTLFEEVLRVPLLFRLPDVVRAGRRCDALFGAVHLMPTILGVAGVDPGPEVVGQDLSGVLRGEEPPAGLWAFAELSAGRRLPLYAARVGDRKYLADVTADRPLAFALSYYGLHGDPEERHPQAATDDEGRAMESRLRAYVTELRALHAALPAAGTAPTEDTSRRLRALRSAKD